MNTISHGMNNSKLASAMGRFNFRKGTRMGDNASGYSFGNSSRCSSTAFEANFSEMLKAIDDPEARLALKDFKSDMQDLDKRLAEKRSKKSDAAHNIEMKNVRAVCMKEITDTVKKYAEDSARQMTDEHRRILRQFISFKSRTTDHLN